MNLEVLVELAALGLAGWAALKSAPVAADFDGERLFKLALSTLIRGEVERTAGDVPAWRGRVLGKLLYNPALGAEPERALIAPDLKDVPIPPRAGERALVERLISLPDQTARSRWAFEEDPALDDALFADPAALGEAYDPALRLAPGLDWEQVAVWSEALTTVLRRRLDGLVLAELGDGWGNRMAEVLPGFRVIEADGDLPPQALAEALLAGLTSAEERLLLVGAGPRARAGLGALVESGPLRDRLLGFISVAGAFDAPEDKAWLAENFKHELLDPEVHRALPYLVVLDGDGPLESWAGGRLPDPSPPRTGRRTIDRVDLGPLRLSAVPDDLVARALWLTLTWRVAG